MPASLAMGCLWIVKLSCFWFLFLLWFIFNFVFNFSSPLSIASTFSPQGGERFIVSFTHYIPTSVSLSLFLPSFSFSTKLSVVSLFVSISRSLFLNPSPPWGEVPRRGDGVLVNCLSFHYVVQAPLLSFGHFLHFVPETSDYRSGFQPFAGDCKQASIP